MVEYNQNLVISKVRQHFSKHTEDKILEILDAYCCNEKFRVQIAIIKLADGDLDELQKLVDIANTDYRDILAWAEYPEQLKKDTWRMSEKDALKIKQRDKKQYLDWLNN